MKINKLLIIANTVLFFSFTIFALAVYPTSINPNVFAVCQGDPSRNCGTFPDVTTCSQNGCSWVSSPTQKPKATQIPSKCQGPADRSCHVFPDQTTCLQNGCSWDSTVVTVAPTNTETTPGGGVVGGAPIPEACAVHDVNNSQALVTIIGDSITEAAKTKLKELLPNAVINSAVGRQWRAGLTIAGELKTTGQLHNTVVYALGTNGLISENDIADLKKIAAESSIILVNNFGNIPSKTPWIIENNKIIERSKIKTADWFSLASKNKSWFSSDTALGVHPNKTGSDAFAQLIADTFMEVPPIGPKPPNYPSDLRQAMIDKFKVTMNGFSQQHLQWAYDFFYATSNTKLPSLIKYVVLEARPSGYGSQRFNGCNSSTVQKVNIAIGQYKGPSYFQFILAHELGHYIVACNNRSVTKQNEQGIALAQEGAVSYYAANATSCQVSGVSTENEDYADMIAYFLHPSAGLGSGPANCYRNEENPYFKRTPKMQYHYNVVIGIL